jgi:hypothetical protein
MFPRRRKLKTHKIQHVSVETLTNPLSRGRMEEVCPYDTFRRPMDSLDDEATIESQYRWN